MTDDFSNKLTKIVVTLGPASDSPEMIERMILAGANVFRFNFKHGEPEWHRDRVKRVREASAKLGMPVGLMMDLQGPSFRIILDVMERQIRVGEVFEFGSPTFTLTHPHIIHSLVKGQKLLVDDGTISFEVVESAQQGTDRVQIKSLSDAMLKTRKSLNIPGADFPIDILTERDYVGIGIAVQERMEIVAFSFSRTAQDIVDVRRELRSRGCEAPICAKLETVQSMENLEGIVKETDIVMVARGDLGVEAPLEELPIYQKRMIQMCLKYGKTVITATQMMASMEHNPFPTRAEVLDVANAVLDNTDAVMLSGETASGTYPVETVALMAKIAHNTEIHGKSFRHPVTKLHLESNSSRVAHAAYKLYEDCLSSGKPVRAFMTFTHSGRTAQLMSHFRQEIPIYAFTTDPLVYGALSLSYGVVPLFPTHPLSGSVGRANIRDGVLRLRALGYVTDQDQVIVVHGDEWGAAGGTSTVRIVQVGQDAAPL